MMSRLLLVFGGAMLVAPSLAFSQDMNFDRPADRMERSGQQTFEFSLDTGVTGSIDDPYDDPVQTIYDLQDRAAKSPEKLRLPTPRFDER